MCPERQLLILFNNYKTASGTPLDILESISRRILLTSTRGESVLTISFFECLMK